MDPLKRFPSSSLAKLMKRLESRNTFPDHRGLLLTRSDDIPYTFSQTTSAAYHLCWWNSDKVSAATMLHRGTPDLPIKGALLEGLNIPNPEPEAVFF